MDLARIQKLAGLPLMEATANSKTEIHAAEKIMGQFGTVVVIDDSPATKLLAKMLGIPDGWKLTKFGDKLWGAYSAGDRLSLFNNDRDFQSDEEGEED